MASVLSSSDIGRHEVRVVPEKSAATMTVDDVKEMIKNTVADYCSHHPRAKFPDRDLAARKRALYVHWMTQHWGESRPRFLGVDVAGLFGPAREIWIKAREAF